MQKKILAVFAHPDDEAFGPGGTLAKYASSGVEINLLCVTRGESGQWSHSTKASWDKDQKIQDIRERELLKSAEILGIKKVEFLDFIDGHLSNAIYHDLAKKIIDKINSFEPQVIITQDRLGISGHLDHIAVSMITTYSYLKSEKALKLYYYCLSKQYRRPDADNYFVYFPEGYSEEQITTKIDYSDFLEQKKKAMYEHKTQMSDVQSILSYIKNIPKTDNFILHFHRLKKVNFPETDLFAGLNINAY